MRHLILTGIAATALLSASAASAQMFTYEITWGEVAMVGGIGPDGSWGRGGTVSGVLTSTYADGQSYTSNLRCVGMDVAPSASVFDVDLACDATDDAGSRTSAAYGCNYLGEPGPETPLGCVGGIRGKAGRMEGRHGAVTMHWYSDTQSRGTGQWYE